MAADEKKTKAKPTLELRISVLQVDEEGAHTQHVAFEVTDQALATVIAEQLGKAVAEQTDVEAHPEELDGHKFLLDGISWADKKKKLAEEQKKTA